MKLKRKRYKLPTTLNTTAKDKAQKIAKQRLIKNAARRIPNSKIPSEASGVRHKHAVRRTRINRKPERSEWQSNTIPPLNPEERGMSGPEPPPTEARVSSSNHRTFPPRLLSRTERTSRLSGPPQAPSLVTPIKILPQSLSPYRIKNRVSISSEHKDAYNAHHHRITPHNTKKRETTTPLPAQIP